MKLFAKYLGKKIQEIQKLLNEDVFVGDKIRLNESEATSGSTYPKEILNSTLEDLERQKCGNCNGTGIIGTGNEKDGYNTDCCEICLGQGYIIKK